MSGKISEYQDMGKNPILCPVMENTGIYVYVLVMHLLLARMLMQVQNKILDLLLWHADVLGEFCSDLRKDIEDHRISISDDDPTGIIDSGQFHLKMVAVVSMKLEAHYLIWLSVKSSFFHNEVITAGTSWQDSVEDIDKLPTQAWHMNKNNYDWHVL